MTQEKKHLNVSVRSFLAAIVVLLILMVGTYALTFLIPAGAYTRVPDAAGNPVLDPGSFTPVNGGLPFWKFLLSPFLVLGSDGGGLNDGSGNSVGGRQSAGHDDTDDAQDHDGLENLVPVTHLAAPPFLALAMPSLS